MMKFLVFAALAIIGVLSYDVEEGVIVGTADNLDQVISENEYALVEFYAPWCGHCKALAPEYAKAAGMLKDKGSDAVLVKVDATVHGDLAAKYEVGGYPTLKFFKRGQESDYTGGRTASDIVNWIEKKSGPPAKSLSSVEDLKSFVDNNEVALVGFFENADSSEAQAFVEAADQLELPFGIVAEQAVADSQELKVNKVVVFKQFDEGRVEYDGELEGAAIVEFAKSHSLPLVVEFSDQTAPKIFGGEIKSHLLMFVDKSASNFDDLVNVMSEVAKENRGEIIFIYLDANNDDNQRVFDYFGVTSEECPTIRLINIEADMAKYKFSASEITQETLAKFCSDYKAGSLTRHMKSEDTPEDWDAKPVKVLTGQNFEEVAYDSSKNVLVEFYAPWCGHCKQLTPIWDKLGEAAEGEDSIVIAKLDATANELSDVPIQGFPTIKLFPAGGDVVEYEGSRTLTGFIEFLNKQTGSNLAVPEGEADDGAADYEDYEEDYDYEEEEGAAHDEL